MAKQDSNNTVTESTAPAEEFAEEAVSLAEQIIQAADEAEAIDIISDAVTRPDISGVELGLAVATAVGRFPDVMVALTDRITQEATVLTDLESNYNDEGRDLLHTLLPFRARMLAETAPQTADESLLVDLAVESYHRWLQAVALHARAMAAVATEAAALQQPDMAYPLRLAHLIRMAMSDYIRAVKAIGEIQLLRRESEE
jgi:hypothetical protein